MSSDAAVHFHEVTKCYSSSRITSRSMKDVILHLPRHIAALSRKKPAFCALDDVSFEVRRGECFGIIGRNGSGKSTALGLIAGVLRPSRGAVETQGKIAPLLELGAGFHPELSGRDNIVLNGILLGLTRELILKHMAQIIAFSELESFIDQPLRTFSTGMMARLGFSVAAHLNPDILLVDEVLAVGDEAFQEKCLKKMAEFRTAKVTMIFVTHNLKDLERICDRATLLDAGRIVEIGNPQDVVREYRKRLAQP